MSLEPLDIQIPDLDCVFRHATIEASLLYNELIDPHEKAISQDSNDFTLTAQQLMMCAPSGFCLKTKDWGQFRIDNILPITWNDQAFDDLILPLGNKEIIHAFVKEQLSRDSNFDDIIQGKGQGFIMLLAGEPGTGKTLTAESVSENMRRPLYAMSAGELGETANEVEASLERALEVTGKWGAFLLLDECDIFLEQRTTHDIKRNRLVSIFLRQLEYFKGVMFLTTNRASTLDAAFESRIHLTIMYPALDQDSRLHIWRTFVTSKSESSPYCSALREDQLKQLAKIQMNGREIKNVVKTARLLAKQKKRPLAMEDVELVLKVKMRPPIIKDDDHLQKKGTSCTMMLETIT